ncbi:MAG: hypothetical protein RSH78_00200 [Bacilli bacterium]
MEFDIKKLVVDTLSPLGVPVSFATRKENNFPFIIFSITSERGYNYEEDEETVTKYGVTVTIFSKGNYESKAMKEVGFTRTNVPGVFYMEDIEVFSQAIEFNFFHYN